MPAHKSASAIGTTIRSDGHFVTALDWRANRLVDCLARIAASQDGVPDLAGIVFKQAMLAAEYCAAFLGTVTHKANHHKVVETRPDGTESFAQRRDSAPGKKPFKAQDSVDLRKCISEASLSAQELARGTKRDIGEVGSSNDPPPTRLHPCLHMERSAAVLSPASISDSMRRSAEKDHTVQSESAFWVLWKENRSKRPLPTQPSVSGADRLAAIRQRLRANG